MSRPLRVAVVGAGPAGIYASDLLIKSGEEVSIDLFEKMPAPFGLIRYGVAPDHPRIKGIVQSLHNVLEKPQIRFLGNVNVGEDVSIDELRDYYDAIIFSTGATKSRGLGIPGDDLPEVYNSGDFVGFYDGNPNFERNWNLEADEVAVVGVGNVALDISRVLAKTADELHVTEIPDNVYETLGRSAVKRVRMFGRRGPAQAKFTPKELKELDESDTIEVIVDPEDIDYDPAGEAARRESKSTDLVASTLESYAMREEQGAPHKVQIHFFERPVEVLSEDGHVSGLVTERAAVNHETGEIEPTGKTTTWPVKAVYSAIGYRSDAVNGLPFDQNRAVIPNDGGHVIDPESGEIIPSIYATGWVKRGPIGLIGNTKSDAKETTGMLVEDYQAGRLAEPAHPEPEEALNFLLNRGIEVTSWEGWHRLDAAERAAGEAEGRERKKVVEWDEMVSHAKIRN